MICRSLVSREKKKRAADLTVKTLTLISASHKCYVTDIARTTFYVTYTLFIKEEVTEASRELASLEDVRFESTMRAGAVKSVNDNNYIHMTSYLNP